MTEIVFDEENLVLSARGHAQGGSYGGDIVCAAVSILIYTLAADVDFLFGGFEGESGKAVPHEKEGKSTLSSGAARIDGSSLKGDERARLLFENLCTGFELLALRYPENVSFKREGKNLPNHS